jgi:membrane-associated phospholipid phosphatase
MTVNKDLSPNVNYSNDITQTFWGQVASYISSIFSPPLVVIYGVLISAYYINASSRWVWATLFIMLFVLPPTLYVYSLLKKGLIEDFHMNIRNERIKPLLVILFNTLLGVGIFYVLGSPKYFIVLALCCLISILLMFFVTLSWKISGHGVAAGGLCVILISSMSEAAIPFTIIVPIIAWSRVILSRHTTMQTIAGVILGFFTFGIPLYLTGLI